MTTLEMLSAHFGATPVIPLRAAAPFWGYEADTLARKIDEGSIPIPYFRLDTSQKAERLVHIEDIAELIDARRQAASATIVDEK